MKYLYFLKNSVLLIIGDEKYFPFRWSKDRVKIEQYFDIIFWPDNATSHYVYAKKTIRPTENNIPFVPKEANLPNMPTAMIIEEFIVSRGIQERMGSQNDRRSCSENQEICEKNL